MCCVTRWRRMKTALRSWLLLFVLAYKWRKCDILRSMLWCRLLGRLCHTAVDLWDVFYLSPQSGQEELLNQTSWLTSLRLTTPWVYTYCKLISSVSIWYGRYIKMVHYVVWPVEGAWPWPVNQWTASSLGPSGTRKSRRASFCLQLLALITLAADPGSKLWKVTVTTEGDSTQWERNGVVDWFYVFIWFYIGIWKHQRNKEHLPEWAGAENDQSPADWSLLHYSSFKYPYKVLLT